MDVLSNLALGFGVALTPMNLLFALIGCLVGTLIGVLPGIGPVATVAMLLPGAFYFLRETRLPPIEALRRHRVPIAIATDCNPGSSPLASPLLAMNMACTLFRLTPTEAIAGFTVQAARALGLGHELGTIEAGRRADLALWDVGRPAELAYAMGAAPLVRRWHDGH